MAHDDGFTDFPKWLKVLMTFINRVGFPIVAFLLMFYVAYVSIKNMTDAVQDQTVNFKITMDKVLSGQDEIKREIRRSRYPVRSLD